MNAMLEPHIDKYNRGVAKAVNGDFDNARTLFDESLSLTKYDRPSLECRKLADDAINGRLTRDAAIHMFKSVATYDQGDSAGMAAELRNVLALEPTYARAHSDLGQTCGMAGNHKQAIENFNEALTHENRYAMAHFNLGVAYDNIGDAERSAEHYLKAIEIDPDIAEAHNNLAFHYARKKETDLMAKYRDRAIALGYNINHRALNAVLHGNNPVAAIGCLVIGVAIIGGIIYGVYNWLS